MGTQFKIEEELLLELLAMGLRPDQGTEQREHTRALIAAAQQDNNMNPETLFAIAKAHGVTALVYNQFLEAKVGMMPKLARDVKLQSQSTVLQNYRLLFLGNAIVERLRERGIGTVLLKGCTTAEYYPVPELRKSGDIDLLLIDGERLSEAEALFYEMGFEKSDEQTVQYHVSYVTPEKIEIELHTMLTEPVESERVNRFHEKVLEECREHIVRKDTMGLTLPTLEEGYHAYYLLLHMLHHFMRAGFGIKLFCDWTAFWSREKEDGVKQDFVRLIKGSGLYGFARMVSAACVGWLELPVSSVEFLFEEGLTKEQAKAMSSRMIRDVLDAEEFGRSSSDRMVALKDGSIGSYISTFHHQMHLNFPKAGKVFLLWPILWCVTLYRFLENNRRLRNVSTRAVMKNARARGRLIKDIRLFEIDESETERG